MYRPFSFKKPAPSTSSAYSPQSNQSSGQEQVNHYYTDQNQTPVTYGYTTYALEGDAHYSLGTDQTQPAEAYTDSNYYTVESIQDPAQHQTHQLVTLQFQQEPQQGITANGFEQTEQRETAGTFVDESSTPELTQELLELVSLERLTTEVMADRSITASSRPSTVTEKQVFTKPSPLPAPVKGMKRMSQGKGVYLSSNDNEESNYSSGGEHSESDRGEEVESPVGGPPLRSPAKSGDGREEKRKKRKSYASDSSDSSPDRRSKKRSKEGKRIHHASREKRSRSRSVSATPRPSDGGGSKHPTPVRQMAPPQQYAHCSSPMGPNKDDVNSVYSSIMKSKSRQNTEPDPDSVSRATTSVSKRVPKSTSSVRRSIQDVELADLMKYLPEGLRDTNVARQTAAVIKKSLKPISSTTRRTALVDAMRYVTHVKTTPRPGNYPTIDVQKYLFSASREGEFGYDYHKVCSDKDFAPRTLYAALNQDLDTQKDSLDMVFRHALSSISRDMGSFEEDGDVTIENPVLISGRYLELRLLQKVQEYYKEQVKEDLIDYLGKICPPDSSPLKELTANSACKQYIGQLLDRYDIKSSAQFKEVLEKSVGTPKNMRVWTDVSTQTEVNFQITNFMNSIFHELIVKLLSLSVSDRRKMAMELSEKFEKRMKRFMEANETFLLELLNASELMAWMCLGITTNNPNVGTRNMALSYILTNAAVKTGKENLTVCMNYPLYSILPKEQLDVPSAPTIFTTSPDKFWKEEAFDI